MAASTSMVRTIATRLAGHSPFDSLSQAALLELAGQLKIRYVEAGETVFAQGDSPQSEVYLVQKGRISIRRTVDGRTALVDVCDEGDLFGVRALLGDRPYAADAKADEASLLYVIADDHLKHLVASVPAVALFFAADFAADVPETRDDRLLAAEAARREHRGSGATWAAGLRPVAASRGVVACGPEASIRAAAQMMSERNVGSVIVVDDARRPVGIVTDADLRKKVVAEARNVAAPIAQIMSAPVVTVEEDTSEATLIAMMMRRGLHHFAVTEDGTDRTAVTGVISEHDIWKTRGNHPTVILSEIRRAETSARLRELRDQAESLLRTYLESETAMQLVARVVSEINDALIVRAVELSTAALQQEGRGPPCPFCWLALGSEGREEQLLRTDQDNALVWDPKAGVDVDAARAYFLELGARVVGYLVDAGFERCPGGVMASEPEWNRTLEEWQQQFQRWTQSPDSQATMRSNISFDFRPVTGHRPLAEALKSFVLKAVKSDRAFLTFFAHAAVQSPPPLSFFRNEIVERSGEHRDTFDIKARAMMPIADGARVMIYDLGLDIYGSTADRWRRIAEAEPSVARVAREAAMAYEILMRVRALEGLRRGSSGRYVHIAELNKLERQTLRSTFLSVADVQQMLTSRFRLEMMR